MLPIQPGEMKANDAVRFFDNICDSDGNKLTKSEKRTRLKEMMTQLYYFTPEKNKCTLKDGTTVEIIVVRSNPGRAKFCYFNNVAAPMDEIFRAFADLEGITYKEQNIEHKKQGDLSANDAKQFLDDVRVGDKKLSGFLKLEKLHKLFAKLHSTSKQNVCKTPEGDKPIVVERLSENNWPVLYLNTSENRYEVLQAFADWAGCIYRKDKEEWKVLPKKQKGELTARDCARIFHNVANKDKDNPKRDASPKLVEWFNYIGNTPELNRVTLPDGSEEPLVVERQSYAQRCWCLNVANEAIKPFVINRMAEISRSDVCMNNIKISESQAKELYQAMMSLAILTKTTNQSTKRAYYNSYAEKIYQKLNIGSEFTLNSYLANKGKEI